MLRLSANVSLRGATRTPSISINKNKKNFISSNDKSVVVNELRKRSDLSLAIAAEKRFYSLVANLGDKNWLKTRMESRPNVAQVTDF